MQKNKIIILTTGTIILIILVVLMIFLERDRTNSSGTESNIILSNNNSDEVDIQHNPDDSSINIQTDQDTSNDPNAETLNDFDETEVREKAIEAITSHALNESATEMTEETLYAHSLLNQNFREMMIDESITKEEDEKQNAEWIAIELMGWHDHATEHYQFNYSEERFLTFIEDQNYLENQDAITSILFEQLKNIDNNLYIRQLETHYLKPFIWHNIEDEVASNMSEDFSDLEEDDEEYQVFLSFDQEIMSNLVEKNPNLFESE